MKNTRELIAEELRSLRAKKQLSIEAVAELSGVNKDTISRYENNLVSMNLENLEKLLDTYNCDFAIFFTNIYANKHNEDLKEEGE